MKILKILKIIYIINIKDETGEKYWDLYGVGEGELWYVGDEDEEYDVDGTYLVVVVDKFLG